MTAAASRKPRFKDTLTNTFITAGILLTLPVLAVLGLMFQFVFLLAIPALLLAVLLVPAVRRTLSARQPAAHPLRTVEPEEIAPATAAALPFAQRFRNAAIGVVLTVAILIMFPLLAIFGLTFQFLFAAAVPIAVIAALAIPGVRRWLEGCRVELTQVRGLSLRRDVLIHSKHGWTFAASRRRAVVGVDDFLQRVLGPVDRVVFPDKGRHVKAGKTMLTLIHGRRKLEVKAPIDGVVKRVNRSLAADPTLVNREPFTRGWLVELRPAHPIEQGAELRMKENASEWLGREIDKLTALVSAPVLQAPSMADGGKVLENCIDGVDDETWRATVSAFFE